MAFTLGFLSVKHHLDHGYFGGYLILNSMARPLEFHCTLPVKPNRAQELLYGPTIADFVCGEQIAKALASKAKLKPSIILTDCAPVLAISIVSEFTAVMLEFAEAQSTESSSLRTPLSTTQLRPITVNDIRFQVPAGSSVSQERLSEMLNELAPNFELTEPFHRITEALLEAHPIAKAA